MILLFRIHWKWSQERSGGTPSHELFISCYASFFFLVCFTRHVPSHASKEVLVVMGALSSCDPGNIFDTIAVSCVCVCGE